MAEYGITVNIINPGWVDTDLGNSSCNDSEFSKEEIIETITNLQSKIEKCYLYVWKNVL